MSPARTEDLLVEIGTEELPAAAQAPMARALAAGLEALLEKHGLDAGSVEPLWGPRRLAILARAIPTVEPDRELERRGPSLQAAFDGDGKPTKAAEGFARSAGVGVEALDTLRTDAGAWLVHRQTKKGRPTPELLREALPALLKGLPQPRRMRWDDTDDGFLRPVRWLCVRYGKAVIPVEALGVTAAGESRGHRIHHPGEVPIAGPAEYVDALEGARVMADPAARRSSILRQVQALAEQLDAVPAPLTEDLYDELAGLVEWPVAIEARFDPGFLDLPEAVVMTTLAHHQRFVPLRDASGRLLPDFIAIANLESRSPGEIRHGLARVVRPRLEDARFYYARDRMQSLAAYSGDLEDLQFGPNLGSMASKSRRLAALSEHVAQHEDWPDCPQGLARRAGELAKCDLVTGMVFEFPELQGIMGGIYAAASEPAGVATAISEQYLPAGPDDEVPSTPVSAALGLADRLDTLVGGFAAGLAPTGTKDAFGLRRAAFGALRIAEAWAPGLDLTPLLAYSASLYPGEVNAAGTVAEVTAFLRERLRSRILEAGERPDVAQAVLNVAPLAPGLVLARASALESFRRGEHAEALAAANKRIANLLRQAGDETDARRSALPAGAEDAESGLDEALESSLPDFDAALAAGDDTRALEVLAALRKPVDRFFDEVLVMDPDMEKRGRRLALLSRLRNTFLRVADISELQPAAEDQ